jgi:hypothetical protein
MPKQSSSQRSFVGRRSVIEANYFQGPSRKLAVIARVPKVKDAGLAADVTTATVACVVG